MYQKALKSQKILDKALKGIYIMKYNRIIKIYITIYLYQTYFYIKSEIKNIQKGEIMYKEALEIEKDKALYLNGIPP